MNPDKSRRDNFSLQRPSALLLLENVSIAQQRGYTIFFVIGTRVLIIIGIHIVQTKYNSVYFFQQKIATWNYGKSSFYTSLEYINCFVILQFPISA